MVKKRSRFLYYVIFMLILQAFGGFVSVMAISEEQKNVIYDYCEVISDSLKDLQRSDSRTRVYLGRYYETILTKFIMPLNVRLVENNLPGTKLISNQSEFNETRTKFVNDYIDYQRSLEELVLFDCKAEPEKFYEKLVVVREKRAVVANETAKLRKLAREQVSLVKALEVKL